MIRFCGLESVLVELVSRRTSLKDVIRGSGRRCGSSRRHPLRDAKGSHEIVPRSRELRVDQIEREREREEGRQLYYADSVI